MRRQKQVSAEKILYYQTLVFEFWTELTKTRSLSLITAPMLAPEIRQNQWARFDAYVYIASMIAISGMIFFLYSIYDFLLLAPDGAIYFL